MIHVLHAKNEKKQLNINERQRGKTSTWNGGDAGASEGGRGSVVVGGCPLSYPPLFLFTVTLGQFFRCSLSLFCYSSSSVFFFSFLPLFYNPSLTLFSAFLSLSVPLQKLGSLSLPHGFLSIICQPSPLFFSSFFLLLSFSSCCSSSIYSP